MRFDDTWVFGFENAIIGARDPMMSHAKMDSVFTSDGICEIGPGDMKLLQTLLSTNDASDSKFMRMIHVQTQITAPAYWLAELDTYKVATVRNSSSLQHKGMSRDYTVDDFTIDSGNEEMDADVKHFMNEYLLKMINEARQKYKETNDYAWFRAMRQLMPMSYNYTLMWDANYAVLRSIYFQRIKHPHRLKEWTEDFANWIKSLPYAEELIMYTKEN